MVFCQKCGTQNVDTAKFCSKCGISLIVTQTEPSQKTESFVKENKGLTSIFKTKEQKEDENIINTIKVKYELSKKLENELKTKKLTKTQQLKYQNEIPYNHWSPF